MIMRIVCAAFVSDYSSAEDIIQCQQTAPLMTELMMGMNRLAELALILIHLLNILHAYTWFTVE
jgi:hypothetical protein